MAAAGYGALLDAVRGVRWPARRPVSPAPPGAHHSRQRGTSSEFAEYRAYRQGDDPRRIDWRLLARTDRVYLRLATDRALLPTLFVVDASASMAFPEPGLDKWRLACDVAIGLAAVAHGEGDPVGLVLPARGGMRALPPRTRRGVVGELARALDESTPEGSAPLAPLLLASHAARRVVVVTDLLGDAEALLVAARAVTAHGGEVHLAHVIAREELEPPGRATLAVDPEDERTARPLSAENAAGYRDAFAAWRAEAAHAWRAAGASYSLAVTGEAAARVVRRMVDPRGATS